MEYGLRRYEAVQRLLWFTFFIMCLGASYFMWADSTPASPQLKDVKTLKFWTGLQGILMAPPAPDVSKGKLTGGEPSLDPGPGKQGSLKETAPGAKRPGYIDKEMSLPSSDTSRSQPDPRALGKLMQFLLRAASYFLVGRLMWLILQYIGKFLLQDLVEKRIKAPGQVKAEYSTSTTPVAFFPRQILLDEIRHFRFSFLFHPFWRLRMMLSGFQKSISSEELLEKERRIVDADWQILDSSWGPYRWIFWTIPVLALVQTAYFLVLQMPLVQMQSASSGQKELLDTFQAIPNSLLPLAQAAGLVIFFKLAAGFVRRIEELYLSNLDALIYDRLLSKLPFQSNDTLIILESLQRQFSDLQAVLKRIERAVHVEKKPGGQI